MTYATGSRTVSSAEIARARRPPPLLTYDGVVPGYPFRWLAVVEECGHAVAVEPHRGSVPDGPTLERPPARARCLTCHPRRRRGEEVRP